MMSGWRRRLTLLSGERAVREGISGHEPKQPIFSCVLSLLYQHIQHAVVVVVRAIEGSRTLTTCSSHYGMLIGYNTVKDLAKLSLLDASEDIFGRTVSYEAQYIIRNYKSYILLGSHVLGIII